MEQMKQCLSIPYYLKFFKGCLPQILFGPFLNTLSQIDNTPKQIGAISKELLNPLSANPKKWSNTLKQFVGNLPTNCLSVFDHLMNLAFKGLKSFY